MVCHPKKHPIFPEIFREIFGENFRVFSEFRKSPRNFPEVFLDFYSFCINKNINFCAITWCLSEKKHPESSGILQGIFREFPKLFAILGKTTWENFRTFSENYVITLHIILRYYVTLHVLLLCTRYRNPLVYFTKIKGTFAVLFPYLIWVYYA